jgi:hypothetical protein
MEKPNTFSGVLINFQRQAKTIHCNFGETSEIQGTSPGLDPAFFLKKKKRRYVVNVVLSHLWVATKEVFYLTTNWGYEALHIFYGQKWGLTGSGEVLKLIFREAQLYDALIFFDEWCGLRGCIRLDTGLGTETGTQSVPKATYQTFWNGLHMALYAQNDIWTMM